LTDCLEAVVALPEPLFSPLADRAAAAVQRLFEGRLAAGSADGSPRRAAHGGASLDAASAVNAAADDDDADDPAADVHESAAPPLKEALGTEGRMEAVAAALLGRAAVCALGRPLVLHALTTVVHGAGRPPSPRLAAQPAPNGPGGQGGSQGGSESGGGGGALSRGNLGWVVALLVALCDVQPWVDRHGSNAGDPPSNGSSNGSNAAYGAGVGGGQGGDDDGGGSSGSLKPTRAVLEMTAQSLALLERCIAAVAEVSSKKGEGVRGKMGSS
jgi:hypothetical protein